jgi:hypothetical protein
MTTARGPPVVFVGLGFAIYITIDVSIMNPIACLASSTDLMTIGDLFLYPFSKWMVHTFIYMIIDACYSWYINTHKDVFHCPQCSVLLSSCVHICVYWIYWMCMIKINHWAMDCLTWGDTIWVASQYPFGEELPLLNQPGPALLLQVTLKVVSIFS